MRKKRPVRCADSALQKRRLVPVTMVTPNMWKTRARLTGQDKDASRVKAIQMYPHWRDLDKKGKGQALADATLIAVYGM